MLQLIPGNLELPFRTLVLKAIQPNVLHENVQAVNKRASRRIPIISLSCGRGENMLSLRFRHKVRLSGYLPACYGGNWPTEATLGH